MQSLNCWHQGKWIVGRFLSLWTLVYTSPRIDACIRNAGETSNARRRRTLQGELPGPGWLVNKPPRFGLVSRVTKFHLSDSHAERMHVSRIHALLCTRACPRANTRAVIHIRDLCTRIYSVVHVVDAPSVVLAPIKILRYSIAVNVQNFIPSFQILDAKKLIFLICVYMHNSLFSC